MWVGPAGYDRIPALAYQGTPIVYVAPKQLAYGGWFDMKMVPEAANMPPTPWQTEIRSPGMWAGAVPRIWRTLSCKAYMPYMPECM